MRPEYRSQGGIDEGERVNFSDRAEIKAKQQEMMLIFEIATDVASRTTPEVRAATASYYRRYAEDNHDFPNVRDLIRRLLGEPTV